MTKKLNHREIERLAAEWMVRRDAGLTPAEEAVFLEWLAADPRHLGAYARTEAFMAHLDRTAAMGGVLLTRGEVPAALVPAMPWITRRRAILGGTAAAGLVAAGAGLFWLPKLLSRESYSTVRGETREILLSDGSMLTLNTASKVLVHYSKEERRIVLVEGEALFDVAKNRRRPFIVSAGDTQVRAVGTSFTVKRLSQEPVAVLVREGVVEVKRPQVPEAAPVRLGANTLALAPPKAPIVTERVTSPQIKRDLAWREGHIAFDNETLSDAAREFSRYSEIKILVSPDIENQTVTGLFVSNDPIGFAKAAALSLYLRVEINGQEITLRKGEGVDR